VLFRSQLSNLNIGLTRDDNRHINYLKRHYGMTMTSELVHMLLKSAYDSAVMENRDKELQYVAALANAKSPAHPSTEADHNSL